MRALALLLLLGGCEPERALTLRSALPVPCAGVQANELRVRGLGDFPPSAQVVELTGATGGPLALPRGTRVVAVEADGPAGLLSFGRSAPLELPEAWQRSRDISIAYGPADAFCATAALSYARTDHHATLLDDGSVLLTGGVDRDGFPVVVLERYLPVGDDESPVARYATVGTGNAPATIDTRAVLGHDATRLADGRVLVTGGAPAVAGLPSGIAYEGAVVLAPDGTLEGPARVLGGGPRAFHAGVRLADGRVMLSGGCADLDRGACADARLLDSVVLYDPRSDTFAPAFSLQAPRRDHRALLRDDGLVIIVGGTGTGGVALPPELWDPSEARGSTIAGPVASPVGGAVQATSGLVFALDGALGASARAVSWSGRDEAPVALPQLAAARAQATLTALEDGTVLVAGGRDGGGLTEGGVLLPAGGSADTPLVTLTGFAGSGHTATLLLDGSVLLAGGIDPTGQASARSAIFLRSLAGPFQTPPTLVFDGAQQLSPSRPDRVRVEDGALVLDGGVGARVPETYALVSGPRLAGPDGAGFQLEVLAGRTGDAEAALVFGDVAAGAYVAVALAVGAPARVLTVRRDRPGLLSVDVLSGCDADLVTAADLPDGGLAPLVLTMRRGRVELRAAARVAPSRPLVSCGSTDAFPARGGVALASISGVVRYDNVQLER